MAQSLKGFADFCATLKTDTKQVFKLQSFQKRVLRGFFAGVIELVILLPKKNGKTTLLGALALYHLRIVEDAECIVVAHSRDQAMVLFRQAAGLVRRAGLEDEFRVMEGTREIRRGRGRIRVLAADAATADGVIPTLALVDELHRHPSGELYGILADGLGPRGGQMITISTAGWDEESPLGLLRKKAYGLPSFIREGAYSYAVSSDGTFEFHEWCLDPGADLSDMYLVKEANPAPWHTVKALTRRHNSPAMTPARWARFGCGVWTFGEMPWLEASEWDVLAVDIGGAVPGDEVCVHVSFSGESGAIALVSPRDGGAVAVTAEIAEKTSLGQIERRLEELARLYQVREVSYDPQEFRRSAELLTERGLPMFETPHSAERVSIVSVTLHRLVKEKLLRHDGNEQLREHVLRGTTKESERGWRFVKSPKTRGLIALAMACHRATEIPADTPGFMAL